MRRVGQKLVAELFTQVALIVTPTSAGGAPALEKLTFEQISGAVHTPYWNATGNPAMSVPMGYTREGLPLGMQIVGRPFEEAAVLAAGHAFQLRTDWHTHVPAMVGNAVAA